jgi:hypothetical protein
MVIRGKSRGDGRQLAQYLLSKRENDDVRVIDIRYCASENLVKAVQEMEYTVELTDGQKGLFHAQLNPAIGEDKNLKIKDWLRMVDIAEEEYGLGGVKRAVVMHEKHGRKHLHVVWQRYDHETGKLRSDSYTHYKGRTAAQRIEEELGLTKTPWRAREKRDHIKKIVGPIWNKTKSPEGFINKLREQGYEVVTSQNRRPFMVMDEKGRTHDLVRSIPGAKTKDVRERFKHTKLRTDKEAIRAIRSKESEKAFNLLQEKSIDRMEEHRSKTEARNDQKKSLADKAASMKENMKETDKEQQKREFKEAMEKALDKGKDKDRER